MTSRTARIVAAVDKAIAAVRADHPGIPEVVLTLASGHGAVHGHFAPKSWLTRVEKSEDDPKRDAEYHHELFLSGESLSRGGRATFGTIVHELTHAYCEENGIEDTSNKGRYHNCFSGDTEFITRGKGLTTFEAEVGRTVEVWDGSSWVNAKVRSYGTAPTRKVTLKSTRGTRNKLVEVFNATDNHRWVTPQGEFVTTDKLSVGDKIASSAPKQEYSKEAFIHGLIFADGTLHRGNTGRIKSGFVHQIRLCGDKSRFSSLFDRVTYPPSANGDPVANYVKSHRNLKELPEPGASARYVGSFIAGWIAGDGYTSVNGTSKVSTVRRDAQEWLLRNATPGGFIVSGSSSHRSKGEWAVSPFLHTVNLVGPELMREWSVVQVGDPSSPEEVYCVEVQGDRDWFTLRGGVLTGNSKFRDQAVEFGLKIERSGTIGWSVTTVPDSTAERYADVIAGLEDALTVHRVQSLAADGSTAAQAKKYEMICPDCNDPVRIGKRWFERNQPKCSCGEYFDFIETEGGES